MLERHKRGKIKTKRIRTFKLKDHKNKLEICKTKKKSPQYVHQNLPEHWSKLNFFWHAQNLMQRIIVSKETSCKF